LYRDMANGSLDTQEGARIANALGILRLSIETQALQRIEKQMSELADKVVSDAAERAAMQ
jgi:hypothetical protein